MINKRYKIIGLIIIAIVVISACSFFTDKNTYNAWEIKTLSTDTNGIAWAKFTWTNDSMGNKYFEKTAMLVPCKIKGLPYHFAFQFDTGTNLTEVSELSISSFKEKEHYINKHVKRLKSPVIFWNSRKTVADITIDFGNIEINARNAYLHTGYGEHFDNIADTAAVYNIGSIGADIFQDKILIIDYPDQRFAICDKMPLIYKSLSFSDISLDNTGRILLPLSVKGKQYKIMFDTGSSIFPLLVNKDKLDEFSTSANTDTIQINSWGVKHNVTGRQLTRNLNLAGQSITNVKVYADYRPLNTTQTYDGITGNILFLNKTIVVDFKDKRFAITD